MKALIKYFQSIKNAELVFPVGITVIVGSTNSGKTAIMRAMMASLENPKSGKHFIHTGADCASVTISDDDCGEFEWIRGEKTVSYRVGQETYTKCGKSDIWSLVPNYPIQKEPNGSMLNFHTEYDSLFPFRYTSGELFSVFERIVSLDDTSSVLRDIQSDLSQHVCSLQHVKGLSDKTRRREEVIGTVEEIERIVKVTNSGYNKAITSKVSTTTVNSSTEDSYGNLKQDAIESNQGAISLKQGFEHLEQDSFISSMSLAKDTTGLARDYVRLAKGAIDLVKDSLLSSVDELQQKEDRLCKLTNNLNDLNRVTGNLDTLCSIEQGSSDSLTRNFLFLSQRTDSLLEKRKSLVSCKGTLRNLVPYTDIPCVDRSAVFPLIYLHASLTRVSEQQRNLFRINTLVRSLSSTPALPTVEPCQAQYSAVVSLASSLKALKALTARLEPYSDLPVSITEQARGLDAANLLSLERGLADIASLKGKESKICQDLQGAKDQMALCGLEPRRRNTSKPHPEHPKYPYLLRNLAIVRANQEFTGTLKEHGINRREIKWTTKCLQVDNLMPPVSCGIVSLSSPIRRSGKVISFRYTS